MIVPINKVKSGTKLFVTSSTLPKCPNLLDEEECSSLGDQPFQLKRGYVFPHYYRIFFNFLFLVQLSPTWVSFKANTVILRSHPIQKVISGIVCGSVVICSILSIKRRFTEKIRDNPESIFTLFNLIIWCSYNIILNYTLWFKPQTIINVLEIRRRSATWTETLKGIALTGFAPIAATLLHCFFFVLDEHFMPLQIWDNYSGDVLFMFFAKNVSQPVEFRTMHVPVQILVVTTFVIDFWNLMAAYLFETLILISSIAVYEIVSNLAVEFETNKHSVAVLLTQFAEMKFNIGRVNDLNGLFLLVTFIQITSYLSGTLIDLFDEAWRDKIIICIAYISNLVLLGFAAEAHFMTKGLTRHIFRRQLYEMTTNPPDSTSSQYLKIFLKAIPGQTGLAGGRFFIITYSLLGTTLSILFTYAIVMIQFKATPPDNQANRSC